MKSNSGSIDRVIRIVVGICSISLGYRPAWSCVGLYRHCTAGDGSYWLVSSIYALGINTCKK